MKQKIYFITYGSSKYNLSRKHLIFLAQKSQFFEECMGFEEKIYQANLDHSLKICYQIKEVMVIGFGNMT